MKNNRPNMILAGLLLIPLALFFVPYAYASATSSDYVVTGSKTIGESIFLADNLACSSGDYAVSGGYKVDFVSDVAAVPKVASSYPTVGGVPATQGQTPNGWAFDLENPTALATTFSLWVVCQTPITIAGIGVPEFGQLYFAVAIGAVVFFLIAKIRSANNTPVAIGESMAS
jgi:hypothetical protein